ncbi:MAG: hypothetical protein HN531_06035 [Opitutae bacterium]|jgi:hypothetical protein|nr:hypothetical protein [Opitutae bacterium]
MNASDVSLKEVELLTVRVLDGLHEQKDMDRLSVLLSSCAAARSRYAELVVQDSLLHWETSEVLEFEPSESKTVLFPKLPLVASFAAAILAVFGVWHWNRSAPSSVEGLALGGPTTPSDKPIASAAVASATPESQLASYSSPSSEVVLEVGGDGPFIRSIDARGEARKGIMILDKKKWDGDGEGGIVEIREDVVAWNREEHLSVPAEQGILPLEGDRMIKLSKLGIDVRTHSAEVSDTVRVLDLREIIRNQGASTVRLNTSVFFNQSIGIVRESTQFSLTVHAIKSENGEPHRSIGHLETSLNSDLNPITWEELNSEFEIPEGTDFLVVALNARREGTNALIPDLGGFYADQLHLGLVVNEQEAIRL